MPAPPNPNAVPPALGLGKNKQDPDQHTYPTPAFKEQVTEVGPERFHDYHQQEPQNVAHHHTTLFHGWSKLESYFFFFATRTKTTMFVLFARQQTTGHRTIRFRLYVI